MRKIAKKRGATKALAIAIVAGMIGLAMPSFANALTLENVEGVTSETYSDDAVIGGNSVEISGEVLGDLVIAGGFVKVGGGVTEDVIAAGGFVTISGDVDDDVRVAGGNVSIEGNIGDDLIVAGGTVTVSANSAIGGMLVATGGTVIFQGSVAEGAKLSGGTVWFDGSAEGDVEISGEQVAVRDGASISGNLKIESMEEPVVEDGAEIGGTVDAKRVEQLSQDVSFYNPEKAARYQFPLLIMIPWILILGAIVLKRWKKKSLAVVSMVSEKPAASFGWGLLALILAPIIGVAFIVTVIALPLGVITMALLAIGLMLGGVVISTWVGRKLIRLFQKKEDVSAGWSLVLGGIIVPVLAAIPYVGGLILAVATVFGFGAIVVSVREWRKTRREKLTQDDNPPPAHDA